MAEKSKGKRKSGHDPISLAPLNFETAIRAAMATGKPPRAKPKPRKKRASK